MQPKRFLVLCRYDWMAPQAGAVEHYVHQVFMRIAAQGHYVAWLCAGHRKFSWLWSQEDILKNVEGIQLAYLGDRFFYPLMVHLFFSRLAKEGKLDKDFHAVVNCINGRTPRIDRYGDISVVPLVFDLEGAARSGVPGDSPVLAATEKALKQLGRAGVEKSRICRVPFAAEGPDFRGGAAGNGQRTRLLAFDDKPSTLLRALAMLENRAINPEVDLVGPAHPNVPPHIHLHAPVGAEDCRALCHSAAFSWCGEGNEWRSLDCARQQIPSVCPRTPFGEEFVIHEETGLLCTPGDSASLADAFERILTDPALRDRLATRAWERSHTVNWDSTARAILDVLLALG